MVSDKLSQMLYDGFVRALVAGVWRAMAILAKNEDGTLSLQEPGQPSTSKVNVALDDTVLLSDQEVVVLKRKWGYVPKSASWFSGMLAANLIIGWIKIIWANTKTKECYVFSLDGLHSFVKLHLSELRALTRQDREEITKLKASELEWFENNQLERARQKELQAYDRRISNEKGYLPKDKEMKLFVSMVGGCDAPEFQGACILLGKKVSPENGQIKWRLQTITKDPENELGIIVDVEEKYIRYLGTERFEKIRAKHGGYIKKLREYEAQAESASIPQNEPHRPKSPLTEAEKAQRRQEWAEAEQRRLSGNSVSHGKKSIKKNK